MTPKNFDHLATEPPPNRCCIDCHTPMQQAWQPPLTDSCTGHWQLTCTNEACPMGCFTFSDGNYPPPNLSTYRKTGNARIARRSTR